MSKKTRGLRDGSGPYFRGIGRRKRVGDICPFDKDNIEDLKEMDIELNTKRKIKVVSDKVGKGRFIE